MEFRNTARVLHVSHSTVIDEVFLQLKALLEPLRITRFYTDDWGAYERNLEAQKHEAGKHNPQKIENERLNLRTRIKRLSENNLFFQNNYYAWCGDWAIH